MKPVEATWEGPRRALRGGYLEPLVLLEPPAHNPGCSCVLGLTYSSGTFVSFFVFTAGCKASGPPGPPLHPPWNPWNIQLSQGTGQGVSMTFNAASRLRSLEDRSAALGSRRCELPGMHSVPKSAVLPYASGVGGLSRRLLNNQKRYGISLQVVGHIGTVDYWGLFSGAPSLRGSQAPSLLNSCSHMAVSINWGGLLWVS